MKRFRLTFFLLLFLGITCICSNSWAEIPGEKGEFQASVKVSGHVLDAVTGDPLIGANVLVEGTNYGAATDQEGSYEITNLPVGTYSIRVQMIGYKSALKSGVRIYEDHSIRLDFGLQPKIVHLGSLLVWGDREAPSEWDNPAALQMITRKQIERSAAQNLGDLLKSEPGLFVYDTGGKSGSKTVSIRGSHANQVLILLDGVKLNPAQNNLVDLSGISLDWVDHIEILKSGGSTLFGNDAIGGVINIVTRKASSSRHKLVLRAGQGSFGFKEVGLGVFPEWNRLQVNFSYQRRSSDGDFRYEDLFGKSSIRKNNTFHDWNTFFQISTASLLGGQAFFSVQSFQAKRGVPGALRQITPKAWLKDRRRLLQSGWSIPLQNRFLFEWTGYWQRFDQEFFSPRPWVFSPTHSTYRNEAYGVNLRVRIFENSSQPLWIGGSARIDQMDGADLIRPRFSIGKVRRKTYSLFALWKAKFDLPQNPFIQKINILPGIRRDQPSDFEPTTSPSFGVSFIHNGLLRITLKSSWGKTYRAPTFNSLFWVEDVFARGNPNLHPERGENRDAGLKMGVHLLGDWEGDVHIFNNRVKNLIYWHRAFDGKYMPVNVAAANLKGREESILWKVFEGRLEINWNHTHLLAINHSGERTTEGKILPFRPEHEENFSVRGKWRSFYGNLSYRWVSKRFTREANTKYLEAYRLWGIEIGSTFDVKRIQFKLGCTIDNLMNSRYQILERYPMPGRSVQITLKVKR